MSLLDKFLKKSPPDPRPHYEIEEDLDEHGDVYHRSMKFCECDRGKNHGRRSRSVKKIEVEEF